jgi:hypothetical protein
MFMSSAAEGLIEPFHPATAPSHYAPSHYAPSHYAPSHYAPSHYAPSHYAPSHYAPIHYAPSQCAARRKALRSPKVLVRVIYGIENREFVWSITIDNCIG